MPYEPKYEPKVAAALLNAFAVGEFLRLVAERLDIEPAHYMPIGPGVDVRDYFDALVKTANRRDLLGVLILAAIADRPSHAGLAAVAESLGLTVSARYEPAPAPAERVGALEKAVREVSQRVDIVVLRERMALAERCIGSVRSGDGFGTAFLIGPNRVLTNWHVAELIEDGDVSPLSVTIRFDWKRDAKGAEFAGVDIPLAANWLVAHRKYATFDVLPPEQPEPTAEELDYAVLELARNVGEEPLPNGVLVDSPKKRGWFDLGAHSAPPKADEPTFLLGHPAKEPLTVAMGRVLSHAAHGRRIRHDAYSLSGSSGSPMLDGDGRLFGLHHGTEPRSGVRARYNQAIPIALIAADRAATGWG